MVSSSVFVSGVAAQDAPASQRLGRRSESQTAEWFEAHRDRPAALRAFVQRMPKGSDIYSHLSGAAYAEHYLEWAAADGYCVDSNAVALVEPNACGQDSAYFPATELINRTETYNALIDLWSTRNLPFASQSGHDQFLRPLVGLAISHPRCLGKMTWWQRWLIEPHLSIFFTSNS